MVFTKGHQIRISITSSNHPRFEKNSNVSFGEDPKPARNTIYFGSKFPSQIILPIVKQNSQVVTAQ